MNKQSLVRLAKLAVVAVMSLALIPAFGSSASAQVSAEAASEAPQLCCSVWP